MAVVDALPTQAHISWWMEEARLDPSFEADEPCASLTGDTEADVVIVGGGYTGMWAAWHLLEREPGIDIVLLEADEICGAGPSGRNGGFCYGMWEDLEALIRMFGDDEAIRLATAAHESVDAIEDWLTSHDVDAWFTKQGSVTAASAPAQEGIWRATVDLFARLGLGDRLQELTADEVRARIDSPVLGGGTFQPGSATLQPARLALGLRRELRRAGVRICEASPVVRVAAGPPVQVETDTGATVRAGHGVVGLGAWTSSLPRYRRLIVPRGTYIVVTEPAPGRLEEIGWTGGEGVGDYRVALHYLRTTPDGRIAFGAASATTGAGVGLGPRLRYEGAAIVDLVDDFRRWFPSFDGVAIERAWGGPMDVTTSHQPFFVTMPGGALHVGAGYTGGGVGPCHMGGRILSGLVTGVEDRWTSLPLVHRLPRRFPPDPFRSIGAAVVQGAIVRRDEAHDRGDEPDALTDLLAHLPRHMGYEIGP
jgi:glycine/D-amino acid oxidase-like deaminating enzyme